MARSTVPRMAEWLTPMSATQSMYATSSMQVSCRTSETARNGRLVGAGCGSHGSAQATMRAAAAVTPMALRNVSELPLMSAFQIACSSAPARTTPWTR
jgi:hypothetical protein